MSTTDSTQSAKRRSEILMIPGSQNPTASLSKLRNALTICNR